MISPAPMPFKEALDAQQLKTLLATTGNTADFRRLAALEPDILRRAQFSARTTSVELLQRYQDIESGILSGRLDQASARLSIKELLAEMGYQPDPEHAGGLQDLSSSDRINLKIETDTAVARGAGWYEQGMQADVLDEWPAQELYRVSSPQGGAKAERDWAARWEKVGGEFFDGRMIALKTDPIWNQLGDSSIFPDGLGNKWAPFAFNSGMRLRDIPRDEAESLGLIEAGTELFPQPLDLNADLQVSPDVRDAGLRDVLGATGLGEFEGDVFKFRPVA